MLEELAIGAIGSGVNLATSSASSAINNKRKYNFWLKQQDELEKRQIAAEKRQFDYNKELQDYVFGQNLAQWERENEYNSPSAQMQRYKNAGLNANLIYGQQNLAGASPEISIGDIGSGQAQQAAPLDVEGVNLDPATLQRLINETKLANANVENINADTEKKETETENVAEDTRGKKIENDFKQDINPIEIEKAAAELNKTVSENELVQAQINDVNLSAELKRYQSELAELDVQIKRVEVDHADELMALRIKKENAQVSFVNHQISIVAKQIASYDDELKARLALSAAETLLKTSSADYTNSEKTYQDFQNRMNDILLDPETDTDATVYWSALMLKNLNETSLMDVIGEIRAWAQGKSTKDLIPSRVRVPK